MSTTAERSVTHATFVLERVYPVAPQRVFRAFADPEAKKLWFGGPAEWNGRGAMDFRVGGKEWDEGDVPGGPTTRFDATYYDIVPDERIVYCYEMHLDDARISVSVTTIELRTEGGGTRLVLTEQGAYLDGYDDAGAREHGTGELLDTLGRSLEAV
jgi:uncharacterized protein YndB with AHSA1/START domain